MKRIIAVFLLILCVNLTACSALNDNRSYTQNNNFNGGTTTNNQTTSPTARVETQPAQDKDPNGYNSLDSLVDFYLRSRTGGAITKKELQKIYPQEVWDNWQDYLEGPLDDAYDGYVENNRAVKAEYTEKYGADYVVVFEIDGVEDCGDGVYQVAVSGTVKGSIREKSFAIDILVRKIDNKWYGY